MSGFDMYILSDPLLDCPTCGMPAEITARFILDGAPGPIEHVKLVCVRRHWYTLPIDELRIPDYREALPHVDRQVRRWRSLMTRRLVALLWTIALLLPMSVDTTSATVAPPRRAASLFFDAIFTSARTAGPGPSHVGHRQIASGILRDAARRRVGAFSFICIWTRIESSGAAEHCRASAFTSDGRLDVAGASRSNSVMHTWRLIGGSGAYRAASGQVTVRDIGGQEALLSAAVTTRHGIALRAGKLNRPAANQSFVVRADDLCQQAAMALANLPEFPFGNFDPLHPDPSLLPEVGSYFTGPGDPRPTLRALNIGLDDLGQPPRARQAWRLAVRARARELAVLDEQDRAALGGHVQAFVRSVHRSLASFRQVAITETVFGSTRCIL